MSLALVLAALAIAGPAVAARRPDDSAAAARAAVRGLLDPATPRSATIERLQALPATDVVRELCAAIRSEDFRSNAIASGAAYDVLVAQLAFPASSDTLGELSSGEPLAVLIEGTTNASSSVRHVCARTLGGALAADRRRVVAPLRALLDTQDWPVVAQAADSLARLGPEAASALDRLLALVDDPDAKRRESFATRAAAETARGSRTDAQELEIRMRSACARARTQIGAPGIDLERYPKLDAFGRTASCSAILVLLSTRIRHPSFGAAAIEAGPRVASPRECEIALGQLAQMLGDPAVRVHSDCVRTAGWIAFDQDESIRAASERVLDAAAKSSDAAILELVPQLRAEIAKRRR